MKPVPANQKLYDKIKKRVYKKYPKHSAYRSGILVKEYKKAFKGPGEPYIGKKPKLTGLSRWFKENWNHAVHSLLPNFSRRCKFKCN